MQLGRVVRIIPPRKVGNKPTGQRYSPAKRLRDAARYAAIERSLSKYIHLSCGHLTTLDTDLVYSHLRPQRGVSFCESCNQWVTVKRPPTTETVSDTPLF